MNCSRRRDSLTLGSKLSRNLSSCSPLRDSSRTRDASLESIDVLLRLRTESAISGSRPNARVRPTGGTFVGEPFGHELFGLGG